jgi:hypothetical protein
MPVTPLTIPAADGLSLGATLYEPATSTDGPVVLVNSATAESSWATGAGWLEIVRVTTPPEWLPAASEAPVGSTASA